MMKIFITLISASILVLTGCMTEDQNTQGGDDNSNISLMGKTTEEDGDAATPEFCKFRGMKPGRGHFHMLLSVLDLTDDQMAQIREKMQAKRKSNREDCAKMKDLSFEEHKALKEGRRKEMIEEISDILTPSQLALLQKIDEQLTAGEAPDEFVNFHLAKMTSHLELTEAQQESIKPIIKNAIEKRLAAFKTATSKDEIKDAMESIREEKRDALKAILTEEQLATLEQFHAGKKGPGPMCDRMGKGKKHGKGFCNKMKKRGE
ncbi:MAG: hypothetical protein HQK83_07790 [Fibrobacteria bacterium]|nr:hypothetical protein [Fibrobacteria bacterium]